MHYRCVKYFCLAFFGLLLNLISAQNLDSLKHELKLSKHDTTRCRLLNEIIETEEDDLKWPAYNDELYKIVQSQLNNQKLSQSEKNIYLKYKGIYLMNKGYLESVSENTSQSIAHYEECLQIRTYLKDTVGIAECCVNLGDEYTTSYKYQKAYDMYSKAIGLAQHMGDMTGVATTFNSIGRLFQTQGLIPKAIDYFLRSIKTGIEAGDKRITAQASINLGTIYSYENDYKNALKHFEKSKEVFTEIGDKLGLFTARNNIATTYDKLNKHDEAIALFNENLKLARELDYKNGIGLSLNNIGASYFYSNNFANALKYYEESLIIREEIGDKENLTVTLNCIGTVYYANGNYKKSIEYNTKALQLSEEIQQPLRIRDAALRLYNAYDKLNQPDKALAMYKLYNKMKDSINNEQTRNASIKSQFQVEFDEKEREVKLKAETEKKLMEQKSSDERKQKNIIIYSILAGLILILVFSFFLFRSLQENKNANKIISLQKHIVEESKREITDSIQYAKRIQFALLAGENLLKKHLPEHFVLFKPKDIVSGDFYWATPTDEGFIFITADCTGHGVPGAFMSLLNISKLSQTISENKITRPDLILNNVRTEIINALNPAGTLEESKDGMDAVLCKLDLKNLSLEYAAANNTFYIIRNNEIIHCKADKMPVGKGHNDSQLFTYNKIELKKGDCIYTYTDGFADQFGGPKGKKFKYKQLEEVLLKINHKPMSEQQASLLATFENWKGHLEQIDDVCLIGIKI